MRSRALVQGAPRISTIHPLARPLIISISFIPQHSTVSPAQMLPDLLIPPSVMDLAPFSLLIPQHSTVSLAWIPIALPDLTLRSILTHQSPPPPPNPTTHGITTLSLWAPRRCHLSKVSNRMFYIDVTRCNSAMANNCLQIMSLLRMNMSGNTWNNFPCPSTLGKPSTGACTIRTCTILVLTSGLRNRNLFAKPDVVVCPLPGPKRPCHRRSLWLHPPTSDPLLSQHTKKSSENALVNMQSWRNPSGAVTNQNILMTW